MPRRVGSAARFLLLVSQANMTARPQLRSLARRAAGAFERHPVLTVFVAATLARAIVAVVSFLVNPQFLIGDELQYIRLASTVASGHGANDWAPRYGQTLYDSTWVFVAPLAALFRLLGDSRLVGQAYALVWGAVTAALTTRLALEVVRPRFALLAGAIVAFMPSQVLWSSVVLRESLIWAGLAGVGLAIAVAGRTWGWRLLGPGVLGLASLVFLALLRAQTLVVAAWALVIATLVIGGRWWWARVPGAAMMAAFIPVFVGLGLGGWQLVRTAGPTLGATRTYMALDADSGFTPTTLLPPGVSRPRPSTTPTTAGSGALSIAARDRRLLVGRNGEAYATKEGLVANLRQLPRGLVATALRPYPWENSNSLEMLFARIEGVAWCVLYVLALAGAWLSRKTLRVVAFPVVCAAGIFLVAALTQGNLGTAFRHRAQVLWALAVLSVITLQRWSDGRRERNDLAAPSVSSATS